MAQLGMFGVHNGDIVDRYIDVVNDLATGEALTSAAFVVTDSDGATVAGVVSGNTYSAARVDFRITAPDTPGSYTLTGEFTIDDGQSITHTAVLRVT